MIDLLQSLEQEDYILNLSEFDNLAVLIIDQSAEELVIVCLISKVGKSLKKSRKSEKTISLSGVGQVAHVSRLKSIEDIFSSAFITEKTIQSIEDLKKIENPADFKKFKPEKDSKVVLRNLILLPPFALKAILPILSKDTPDLACAIPPSAQNFKD